MSESRQDTVGERSFAQHEHHELLRGIDRIHDLGCAVGRVPAGEVAVALHRVVAWAEHELEDHAAWEEGWLYPELDRRAGSPWATKLMRFEHQQIREAVRRLAADRPLLDHELAVNQCSELRAHIFGLEALIRAHMECEDRVLIPLLDAQAAAATGAAAD